MILSVLCALGGKIKGLTTKKRIYHEGHEEHEAESNKEEHEKRFSVYFVLSAVK